MKEFTIPTIKDIAAELHYEVEILRPNEQNPAFERATLAAQVAVLAELFNRAVEQRENDLAELQRGFNNRTNWCIGAGSPCHACTEPEFPDKLSPLYQKINEERLARFKMA